MPAARDDWIIERGAAFSRSFQYTDLETEEPVPFESTPMVAELAIRAPNAAGDLVERYLSTDADSPVSIDEADGVIDVELLSSHTRDDVPDEGGCDGWYTLRAWPVGDEDHAIRMAEGFVRWTPESTRPDESEA